MCDGERKVPEPLDGLLEGIEGFVRARGGELTPFELGERLIRLRHGIDLLEVRFAREAAAFAATEEAAAQGSTSAIDWVRHQCAMSGNAAARSIATGEAAERLPASVAALDAGRIGFAHLALLAGTERALRDTTSATGFDERPLLALALEHSVSRFAYDCTHARHAADAATVLGEQVAAVESRRLELAHVRTAGSCSAGCSTRWVGPPCGSPWNRSAAGRASVTIGRGRAGSPMGSLSSPVMRSTMASLPSEAPRAPISSSPPRWRR